MGEYRITRKGIMVLMIMTVIAILSMIKGSIYLAVFSFIFFSFVLAITLYEFFINK